MLSQVIDFIRSLTDPEKLIHLLSTVLTGWVGYLVLFLIVFAESGMLIGFFLPGDSLLFTIGVVAGAGKLPIGTMIAMLAAASILGDGSGFFLGKYARLPAVSVELVVLPARVPRSNARVL